MTKCGHSRLISFRGVIAMCLRCQWFWVNRFESRKTLEKQTRIAAVAIGTPVIDYLAILNQMQTRGIPISVTSWWQAAGLPTP